DLTRRARCELVGLLRRELAERRAPHADPGRQAWAPVARPGARARADRARPALAPRQAARRDLHRGGLRAVPDLQLGLLQPARRRDARSAVPRLRPRVRRARAGAARATAAAVVPCPARRLGDRPARRPPDAAAHLAALQHGRLVAVDPRRGLLVDDLRADVARLAGRAALDPRGARGA